MIEFTEVQSKESLGTVELKDGKLEASFPLQSMVDAWRRQGKSAEEFMEFYGGDGWSNGYIVSQEVDGKPAEDAPAEEPAPEKEVQVKKLATFAQGEEELSPITVIEKLRDLVAADVESDPERGPAGEEANEQMENYVELIHEAKTDEDVKDIIVDILEEVPIEDYDGAEDIVTFLKGFVSDEKAEPAEAEKAEGEEPAKPAAEETKTLRYKFPSPLKK